MRMSWTVSDEVRAMTLVIDSEPVPLAVDVEGVARVGGTRVTLDTLVAAFEQGATAEEIAQQYPSLGLADVYAVIGYYLRRRPIWRRVSSEPESSRQRTRRASTRRVYGIDCWPGGAPDRARCCGWRRTST
jgi:uncharacterized protein (DUF433 family)